MPPARGACPPAAEWERVLARDFPLPGKFVNAPDGTHRDRWGNRLVLGCTSSGRPVATSLGRDGAPGGDGPDADLTVGGGDAR